MANSLSWLSFPSLENAADAAADPPVCVLPHQPSPPTLVVTYDTVRHCDLGDRGVRCAVGSGFSRHTSGPLPADHPE
jgi:hypothetical protein